MLDQRAAQFDLSLTVAEVESGFEASFEYNTDLFDASTIERLYEHFAVLLESIVSDPWASVSKLQLLSSATRRQLLYDWNDTRVGFGVFACVHELIAQHAASTPDQIAVVSGAETLTYRELNARANRLAHYLRARGVGPEVPVGISLPRSAAMVICVLGVLKAGGAYVPLDPSYPKERLSFMLEDSGAALLLNKQFLDREATAIDAQSDADPSVVTTSENLAYIIYTSGSTGTPKGVMVQHGSLTNYISAANRAYEIVPEDRILQFAPFSFDASVEEIFACLTSGAMLVLRDGDAPKSPIEFMQECRKQKLTVLDLPTAYWHELVAYLDADEWAADLRLVIIGGDKVLPDRVRRWHHSVGPDIRLVNTYGPTEATVVATMCEGPHADVSIGRPVANTHAYILDEHLQPVMCGARGELCLGGANVSRGYRGDSIATAEKFIPDPFSAESGARLYRTGDLARWRADGQIEFLGRLDHQVKIRGHRIEPVEIEAALLTHEAVGDAVVVARDEASGERRLAAYVVGNATALELRSFLTFRLPPYLIPATFTLLDVLPRLPSGKIDRRALPSPDHFATDDSYVAPTTSTERVLCDLWAEVLKLERAGVHDNFFALGGDSILSIQVAARARLAGLQLSPSQIFQHPTPAELSKVASIVRADHGEAEPLTGDVPLTPIQHWFFEQQLSVPDHWNMAVTLEAHERLDPDLLDQALAHLVRHHDALRLRFTQTSGGWRQFLPEINAQEKILRVVDQHLEQIADETQAQLDLAKGALLRAVLFDLGERQRLLIVAHHLVVDGVSWRILLEDLANVYRQLQRGEAVTLPAKTTSFARWARLLSEYKELRHELDYWTSLASEGVPPLPIDFPDGSNVEADTRTVTTVLDVDQVYGAQINEVLLTALLDALSHWTNERRILIELEGHGREELFDDVDLARTVGWFTDQFPVLLEAKAGLSPIAMLHSVRQQLRNIPRRGIGYGLLRYLNDDTPELRHTPSPEVSFNYLGQLDQTGSALFSLSSEFCGKTRHPTARRGALLEINAYVSNQQLRVDWNYSSGLHGARTIENLAQRFTHALRAILSELHPSNADEDLYPLSPLQQGILFHSVYEQGSAIYVGQLSFALHGKLDTEAFSEAWRRVVARHEILRTSFIWENREEPLQRVSRSVDLSIETYDWRGSSHVDQQSRLTALLSDDRRLGFDLTTAPLMRLKLVRLGDESYRFIWTHHHLLLDGWSIALLLDEVFNTKPAAIRQYRDYIAWLRQQDLTQAKIYWRDYLHGFLAPTPLAVDHAPAVPAREADTRRLSLRLSHSESDRLRTFALRHQLTLSTLAQGAWALLLSRYSREADVVYGATVAGRPASFAGVERMIGLFINTLPVRVRLQPGMSILAWLKDLQAEQVASREYEHSPLVELQALSAVPRGTPLFESLLVFENYPLDVGAFGVNAGVEVGDVWWFDQTNYPLTIVVRPERELSLEILYEVHRFSDDVVQRMLGHLQTILNALTTERAIAHVSLVSDSERSVLLSQPTETTSTLDHCVHQLFEEQAQKTPDRIALACGTTQLTYAELNTRANRLARYLLRHGVAIESRVGICLEPGVEMIVAVLAVLKTGAAYVPLDPAYPESRLAFMLQDCGARVLLTEGRLLDGRLPGDTARVIAVDEEREEISRESPSDSVVDVLGDNLIYVIYTSGSTGRPKGAGVTHRGFANLVRWFVSEFGLGERDRALIISSFSFDLTQKDLFAPLTLGGQVHFPSSGLYDPAEIVNTISEAQITLINCTPSAFYPLVETAIQKLSPLKHVFLGGEPINVTRLRSNAYTAQIVNTYGPTEAADVCSSFCLTQRFTGVPPIGKPIDNVELLILDEQQNLVPQGIPGELCVGGVGVGRGYLNDPAATAERFIPHPFSAQAGARLYRTGDLVRRLPDGNIEFLNRLDHQVKVAGYRIELGEVESSVVQHRDVKECVVVVRPDAHGDARLVAYVVPKSDAQLDVSALRRYLADSLPAHTIPSLFVAL
ncbi:MAG TPA: amino acid adenylation domain-containing protein, partial [Pyrinomonadaceae bacterium]|nr:amino acid adenylation domain-containing protein [Pyrinomonadaceae bacterium]